MLNVYAEQERIMCKLAHFKANCKDGKKSFEAMCITLNILRVFALHPLCMRISRLHGVCPFSLKIVQHLRWQHKTTGRFFQQLLVQIDVDLQYQRTTKPQRDWELFLILEESHSFKCDKELTSLCLRRRESSACTTASLKRSIPAVSNYIGCSAECSAVLKTTFQRLKHWLWWQFACLQLQGVHHRVA